MISGVGILPRWGRGWTQDCSNIAVESTPGEACNMERFIASWVLEEGMARSMCGHRFLQLVGNRLSQAGKEFSVCGSVLEVRVHAKT